MQLTPFQCRSVVEHNLLSCYIIDCREPKSGKHVLYFHKQTSLLSTGQLKLPSRIWPGNVNLGTTEVGRARNGIPRRKSYVHNCEAESGSECASNANEPGTQAVSESLEPLRILFAAGGTGGHVYPAIAIADAVKDANPTASISFAGTRDRMEWTAVPKAGYPIYPVPAVSLKRPLWSPANLFLPFRFLQALVVCWNLIGRIKPQVVVGTGGYVSAPTCLVGWLRGCQVAVAEQNAYAGLANRLVSRIAAVVFVAFESAKKYFPAARCQLLGNPVRKALFKHVLKAEALDHFFPRRTRGQSPLVASSEFAAGPSGTSTRSESRNATGDVSNVGVPGGTPSLAKDVVLVLGGSLGASAINKAVEEGVEKLLQSSPSCHVIWQTGAKYHETVLRQVAPHPRLAVVPFIDNMACAYAAADVAIARAGAITCSELMATGTPAILVPSPNVAENHQTRNAEAVVQVGAARLLEERHMSPQILVKEVQELLGNKELLTSMRKNALASAFPCAATNMARVVVALAKCRRGGVGREVGATI